MHDYVLFNSKIMGFQIQNTWNAFETDRIELIRHCIILNYHINFKIIFR